MLKNQAFILYTYGQCIAHGLKLLEIVPFIDIANSQILQLFIQIQLNLRNMYCSLLYRTLKTHTGFLVPLGNAIADLYTRQIIGLTGTISQTISFFTSSK